MQHSMRRLSIGFDRAYIEQLYQSAMLNLINNKNELPVALVRYRIRHFYIQSSLSNFSNKYCKAAIEVIEQYAVNVAKGS